MMVKKKELSTLYGKAPPLLQIIIPLHPCSQRPFSSQLVTLRATK